MPRPFRLAWPLVWTAGIHFATAWILMRLSPAPSSLLRGAVALAAGALFTAPLAVWDSDGWRAEYIQPALVAALAAAWAASPLGALVAISPLAGWLLAAGIVNVRALWREEPLPLDPFDILGVANFAALAGMLLAAPIAAFGAVATVLWWLGDLRSHLPMTSARRTRWLVGGLNESRYTLGGAILPPAHQPVWLSLCPALSRRRSRCRAAIDRAFLLSAAGASPSWRAEQAWQEGIAAVAHLPAGRTVAVEVYSHLVELAFRAGRWPEVCAYVERLNACATWRYPTKATVRLLAHAALLALMARARLGRTLDAEAVLAALAETPDADTRLLSSLAEATVLLARGHTRDLPHRLRRSLPWANHPLSPAADWWRDFAQVIAAEAALLAGDESTAETYLVRGVFEPGPHGPLAALLLADARTRRGDAGGAAAALDLLLANVPSGPLAHLAEDRLAALRSSPTADRRPDPP